MYPVFYIFLVTCSILSTKARDCVITKGYAYQQATLAGSAPRKKLDESGKQVDGPVKKLNAIYIYVETSKSCNLTATGVWIGEMAYHITQQEVLNFPVVIQ